MLTAATYLHKYTFSALLQSCIRSIGNKPLGDQGREHGIHASGHYPTFNSSQLDFCLFSLRKGQYSLKATHIPQIPNFVLEKGYLPSLISVSLSCKWAKTKKKKIVKPLDMNSCENYDRTALQVLIKVIISQIIKP